MAKKIGKRGKIIFGVFASLAIAVTTIVLCVTYIPIRPTAIYNSINIEVTETLNQNKETCKTINYFIDNSKSELSEEYLNEMETFQSVIQSVYRVFSFYQQVMPNSSTAKINRGAIKKIESSISIARNSINSMGEYLEIHNKEIFADGVNVTLANIAWENLRDEFSKSLTYYADAFEGIADVYAQTISEGVYANEIGRLVAYACADFVEEINEFIFGENPSGKEIRTRFYFNRFTSNYMTIDINNSNKSSKIIEYYYTSDTLKENYNKITNINKISFKQIMEDEYRYVNSPLIEGLTNDEKVAFKLARDFLVGEWEI